MTDMSMKEIEGIIENFKQEVERLEVENSELVNDIIQLQDAIDRLCNFLQNIATNCWNMKQQVEAEDY